MQDGITLEVNVTTGRLLISASIDERNPTSKSGHWIFNISGFEKVFLHRYDLFRYYDGPVVFLALYGLSGRNKFCINILVTKGNNHYYNNIVSSMWLCLQRIILRTIQAW